MKFIIFALLFLPSIALCQFDDEPFVHSDSLHASTKLERIAYVVGASAAFSLLDFIGFNVTQFSTGARTGYRILQVASQIAISYLLYQKFGLTSAISFNLIWWTWGDDLGFYGWTNLVNPASPWYNRENNGLHGNQVTWAGWTPIGLLRRRSTIVDKYALFAQALIGFSISIAIL